MVELLKGNLLTYIVLLSLALFSILYGQVNDGRFRRVFCYYRKENARDEWKIAGMLLVSVGVVSMGIYYGLCHILKVKSMGMSGIGFEMLALLACYFVIFLLGREKTVGLLAIFCGFILGAPLVIFVAILAKEIQFDPYYIWLLPILLGMNIYLGRKTVVYWKEGDW